MTESVDIQAFAKAINELLVLGVLDGGPRHGYQIALDVEQRSGGLFVLQHGTLYPILHRLEGAGLITGRWQQAAGRRRRAYRLTAAGRRRLRSDAARVREVLACVASFDLDTTDDAVSDAS
jgi:PadR family transcriptional regulator, regulatory protein PadR